LLGQETAERLRALIELVEQRMPQVIEAQRRYDARGER
jgi:hypothetical protein